MIIGYIHQNLDQIANTENLKLAFDFLKSYKDFDLNANDKIEIKGDEVFAMYSENNPGRTLLLESHLKFIDIHFVIEGNDRFAYAPLGYDGIIEQSRNIENDLITYSGDYPMDFNLNKDFFVVLFPQDIHSPCLEPVRNKKIVVKVAIG
jgi:YhcH/YjgK/YiaL family protein